MTDMTPALRFKRIGNLVNLATPLGLGIAALGHAPRRPGPRGLVLAEGYRLRFPIAGAFTVGNVVITPHRFDERMPRFDPLIRHEERHSWQWLACGGLPFLTLYTVAVGWSWLRTGDRASHNWFEVNAGLQSGGYRRRPARHPIIALRGWLNAVSDRGRNRGVGPNGRADGKRGADAVA